MASLELLPDDFLRRVSHLLIQRDQHLGRFSHLSKRPVRAGTHEPRRHAAQHAYHRPSRRPRRTEGRPAPCCLPIVAVFSCCRRLHQVSPIPIAVEDVPLQHLPDLGSGRFAPVRATFRRFAEMDDQTLHKLAASWSRSLTELDLGMNTGVTDIGSLGGCTKLQRLQLPNTNLVTVSSLACCTALRTLDLSNCAVLADVSGLRHCHGLERVSLKCSLVDDISALEPCTALLYLDLSETAIACLKPVSQLVRLKTLLLSGMERLVDISAVASCAQLTELDLSCCGALSAITPLQWCEGLGTINLNHTSVTDEAVLLECLSLKCVKVNYELAPEVATVLLDRSVEIEDNGSLEDWGLPLGDSSEDFDPFSQT